LRDRGIGVDTAQHFEVGAWHGRGMLLDCIAARLHDLNGAPIGYAGRRRHPDARGKWVFPSRLPAHELLYGWHRLPHRRHVVVVEGIWDVLRLHQLAVPAVALLGTRLSPIQHHMLRTLPRCTILLDGNHAGRTAALRIARRLGAPQITLHNGRDPTDLTDHQLYALLAPHSLP